MSCLPQYLTFFWCPKSGEIEVKWRYIDTAIAETALRDTFNSLITYSTIRELRKKSRLKEFSAIHNFFISFILKDYDKPHEIELLSQVNDVDNDTYFITQINKVLDGEDDSEVLVENIYAEAYEKKILKNKDIWRITTTYIITYVI